MNSCSCFTTSNWRWPQAHDRIEARLHDFRVRGVGVLPISFSWGTADAHGRALRDALDEADRNMYAFKRQRFGPPGVGSR